MVQSSTDGLEMFHAKFECCSMYTAWGKVQSTQEYSVHAHQFVCVNFLEYVVSFSRYGLEIFHAKFECPSMYAAQDIGLSTQESSVHAR